MSTTRPLPASAILHTLVSSYRRGRPRGDLPCRVRVGCAAIDDDVLCGGVQRGVVLGLSADVAGEGVGRVLSLHYGTSVLLSSPNAKVSIIDTTGSFPVSLLADIFRARLTALGQKDDELNVVGAKGPGGGVEERVQALLQRVEITRAFDIEGVLEVLSDVAHKYSEAGDESVGGAARETRWGSEQRPADSELEDPNQERGRSVIGRPKVSEEVEILDSEAEDDEVDSEPEIRLVDLESRGASSPKPSHSNPDKPTPGRRMQGHIDVAPTEHIELIIVDNMTMPIHELLARKEKKDAHALLLALSRTLRSLSQTHAMLLMLLNSLAQPRSSAPHQHRPVSVFAATRQRPSLGRAFADLVALHVLITRVPRRRRTGAAAAAPPYCHVLEVLKDDVHELDRWLARLLPRDSRASPAAVKPRQSREQRWAPFALAHDGLRLVSVELGVESGAKPAVDVTAHMGTGTSTQEQE